MDDKDLIIAELRETVARLTAEVNALMLELAKAKKDSTTSSKPPSSDIAQPKPKRKRGSRKKPRKGGQPGHQRQLREPLPPEQVDEIVEFEIDAGETRRLGLAPTGNFETIQ